MTLGSLISASTSSLKGYFYALKEYFHERRLLGSWKWYCWCLISNVEYIFHNQRLLKSFYSILIPRLDDLSSSLQIGKAIFYCCLSPSGWSFMASLGFLPCAVNLRKVLHADVSQVNPCAVNLRKVLHADVSQGKFRSNLVLHDTFSSHCLSTY